MAGRASALLLVAVVLLSACAAGEDGIGRAGGARLVVATTTVLGDLVRSVAGDAAEVEVLIPEGADPHDFALGAGAGARLRRADLVVTNGLGLEASLRPVLEEARREGTEVLEVGPALDPIEVDGSPDPHVWMDPLRFARAARLVGRHLGLEARGEAYAARLVELHRRVEALLAPIPDTRRRLVVDHDWLTYFARRYRFRVVGTVVPGLSTLARPSAAHLADLAETIEREGVPAVFVETTQTDRLARVLAREVGSVRVVTLYGGSLGPAGSEADTYEAMILTNARRIREALT